MKLEKREFEVKDDMTVDDIIDRIDQKINEMFAISNAINGIIIADYYFDNEYYKFVLPRDEKLFKDNIEEKRETMKDCKQTVTVRLKYD